MALLTETFYEEVIKSDVAIAYEDVEKIAEEGGKLEEYREQVASFSSGF